MIDVARISTETFPLRVRRCYLAGRCSSYSRWPVDHGLCPGDFDNDAALTVQDIFGYIDAFITNSDRADADTTLAITLNYLFTFLDSYFAGCQ